MSDQKPPIDLQKELAARLAEIPEGLSESARAIAEIEAKAKLFADLNTPVTSRPLPPTMVRPKAE